MISQQLRALKAQRDKAIRQYEDQFHLDYFYEHHLLSQAAYEGLSQIIAVIPLRHLDGSCGPQTSPETFAVSLDDGTVLHSEQDICVFWEGLQRKETI